jgi:hypothetical protein
LWGRLLGDKGPGRDEESKGDTGNGGAFHGTSFLTLSCWIATGASSISFQP